MEKITITEINKIERPGKATFWGCKILDGREATCWDEEMAKTIEANLNKESDAVVKAQGSFINIRQFTGSSTMSVEGTDASTGASSPIPGVEMLDADGLSVNAKSSVKLIKNSKGINWEVKVVTGEGMLIPTLTTAALAQHRILCAEFPVEQDE